MARVLCSSSETRSLIESIARCETIPSWLLPRGIYSVRVIDEETRWLVFLVDDSRVGVYDGRGKRIFGYRTTRRAEQAIVDMLRDGAEIELLDTNEINQKEKTDEL